MLSIGVVPNIVTYTLINGLCYMGKQGKEQEVLQQMIYRGHEPNIVTYTTFVDGLCQKGLLDMAK